MAISQPASQVRSSVTRRRGRTKSLLTSAAPAARRELFFFALRKTFFEGESTMNAANLSALTTIELIRRGRSIIAGCLAVNRAALLRGLRHQAGRRDQNTGNRRNAA